MPSTRDALHAELYAAVVRRLQRYARTGGDYVGGQTLTSVATGVIAEHAVHNMKPRSLVAGLQRLGVAETRPDGYWVDPSVERVIATGNHGKLTVVRHDQPDGSIQA